MEEIQISMQEGRGRQGKAPKGLNSVLLLLLMCDLELLDVDRKLLVSHL